MNLRETVLAATVVLASTVAAITHVIDAAAYTGLLGTVVGYLGKTAVNKTQEGS